MLINPEKPSTGHLRFLALVRCLTETGRLTITETKDRDTEHVISDAAQQKVSSICIQLCSGTPPKHIANQSHFTVTVNAINSKQLLIFIVYCTYVAQSNSTLRRLL